jgi:hypothetical protein
MAPPTANQLPKTGFVSEKPTVEATTEPVQNGSQDVVEIIQDKVEAELQKIREENKNQDPAPQVQPLEIAQENQQKAQEDQKMDNEQEGAAAPTEVPAT